MLVRNVVESIRRAHEQPSCPISRQTDRQTDRLVGWLFDSLAARHTDRQTDTHAHSSGGGDGSGYSHGVAAAPKTRRQDSSMRNCIAVNKQAQFIGHKAAPERLRFSRQLSLTFIETHENVFDL